MSDLSTWLRNQGNISEDAGADEIQWCAKANESAEKALEAAKKDHLMRKTMVNESCSKTRQRIAEMVSDEQYMLLL